MTKTKCPHCGQTVRAGNFCEKCSKKMVATCDCWVLGKPYDCGEDECPGQMLIVKLVKHERMVP